MKTSSRLGPGDRHRADVDAELGEQPRDDLRALRDGDRHLPLVHAGLDAEPLADPGDGELVVVGAQGDPVGADAGLQRLRGVLDDDLAVVHDRDPVAVLGLVHVVRGHEDGDLGALPEVVQVVPDRRPGLRVQADRGLVEEQHLRRVHQAAGDLEPALHAAGELHDDVGAAVGQRHHLQDLVDPALGVGAAQPVEVGVEPEVLLGGQLQVQGLLLEDQPDPAAHLVALGDDVEPGDPGGAGRRVADGAEHLDGRGLARRRWARGSRRSGPPRRAGRSPGPPRRRCPWTCRSWSAPRPRSRAL